MQISRENICFNVFKAAEAESITGVSINQQKNLRRHGYIRKFDGSVKYNLRDLIEMALFDYLNQQGLPPKVIFENLEWLVSGVAWHFLGYTDAYSGFDFVGSEVAIDPKMKEAFDSIKSDFIERGMEFGAERLEQAISGSVSVNSVRKLTHNKLGFSRVIPARYFVKLPCEEPEWMPEINDFLESEKFANRGGGLILLDQMAFARHLSKRTIKPSVNIKLGEG